MSCCRAPANYNLQPDAENSDDNIVNPKKGTHIRESRRRQGDSNYRGITTGLHNVSEREKIFTSVHVLKEKQKEENDGLLEFPQVR